MPPGYYRRYQSPPPLPDPSTLPFPGALVRACDACGLRGGCKAPVPGKGPIPARVMFVGEAPGKDEDEWGYEPFVGRAGQQLDSLLQQIGLPRPSVYVTNTVRCRPPNNRDPRPSEVRACSRWLELEIGLVDPHIIVAMGAPAIRWFLGEDAGTVEHLHGRPVTRDVGGVVRVILPCYHPAAALHQTAVLRHVYDDFQVLRGLVGGRDISDYAVVDEYPDPDYRVLDSDRLRLQLADDISSAGEFGIDTEVVKQGRELWSVQISTSPGTAWFVPVKAGFGGRLDVRRFGATAIVHNYLYDIRWLAMADDMFVDTMVMAYLLGLPQGLKELAYRLCGMRMSTYSEMVRPGQRDLAMSYLHTVASQDWPDPEPVEEVRWDNKAGRVATKLRKPWHITRKVDKIIEDARDDPSVDPYARWQSIDRRERAVVEASLGPMPESSLADIEPEDAVWYACRDADATLRVKLRMDKMIRDAGLDFVLHSIDLACLPMVSDMMANGMAVDILYLKALSQRYSEGMDAASARAASRIGHPFNPSSSKQVAAVVYGELGFKPTRKTPTGLISTDDRELKKVPHPVIKDILEYRRLSKNKGTFADSLVSNSVPHSMNGATVYRVHTTLKVTRTETGRLSSSEPVNLQTMPTRTEEGKKIRMGFPATPGYRLLAGDFIQQEMKVQAHLAKCKAMLDMFLRNADFHTETAARIFGVPLDVAKGYKYRYPAKTMNFAVIYLISAKGLSETIQENAADIIVDGQPLDVSEWTPDACERLIADWYKLYPEKRDYQVEQIAFARRFGYVVDMFGRRRYTPEVTCPIRDVREAGERQVVNFPVQASSQGITKLAMAAAWRSRNRLFPPDDVRFLMQIHDELMLEVRDDDDFVLAAAKWLKDVMDNVVTLSIPMVADVKAGDRWGDMREVEL